MSDEYFAMSMGQQCSWLITSDTGMVSKYALHEAVVQLTFD